MIGEHELHTSGWVTLNFAFTPAEIDELIEQLQRLKAGELSHFHFRRDEFPEEPGIADVEISMMGEDEVSNMKLQ